MDRISLESDGLYRADRSAGGVITMSALKGHRAVLRSRDNEAGICLEAYPEMIFDAGCLAGKAPDTTSEIRNDKTVHKLSRL